MQSVRSSLRPLITTADAARSTIAAQRAQRGSRPHAYADGTGTRRGRGPNRAAAAGGLAKVDKQAVGTQACA
jgi:hypothetical protein